MNISVASFDTASAISLTANFDTLINNQTAILTATPIGLNYFWNPIESILNACIGRSIDEARRKRVHWTR